ncbi:MAG: ferritin family protein [Phycisphaerales bacterium]|nr:MAG: ferritin family protein [Phycisphaerales bacterium]
MPRFRSINDILDFAIVRENEAHDFYVDLAQRVTKRDLRELIKGFAIDEQQHAIRLEAIKAGEATFIREDVGGLEIAETVHEAKPEAKMDYADLLIIAMNREKAAFRLYTDLASIAPEDRLRDTLLSLAREEAQHKLTLEIEYDWVAS